MVLYPVVRDEDKVVEFRCIELMSHPMPGLEYVYYPDSDGYPATHTDLAVDSRIVADTNSASAVQNAIASSPQRKGYLTSNLKAHEKLHGASLGLAVAVELARPGQFTNVAFTGLVSSLNPHDCTLRVHDVDNVPLKIRGALAKGVPLVFPFSDAMIRVIEDENVLTPKKLTMLSQKELVNRFSLGTAYSLVEAINVARYLVYKA